MLLKNLFVKIKIQSAGAKLKDIDRAIEPYNFVAASGLVSETGFAGLALGGGLGYLTRMFGLSCDNIIEFELVTQDAQVMIVNKSTHNDLFWALQGGGGNFGGFFIHSKN